MGCNQSTPGGISAHSNYGRLPNGEMAFMSDGQQPKGDVGQAVLERYIELEGEIAVAEQNSPKMVLEHKRAQVEELKARITEQEIIVEQLETSTKKEKQDVDRLESGLETDPPDSPDTKQLFLEQDSWEARRKKEMQEYLDAKNQEEIAKKELATLLEQHSGLEDEISALSGETEQLQSLYDEQESLLAEIFGGSYGSDAENRLEASLDQHEEMRARIVEANFKWRQAQLMVDYAHKQLEHAVQRWMQVIEVDAGNLEGRYAIASETRNNLVAAAQNIQGAQRYLSNVQFPYCAPPEVDTLNKATAYIFTDMQTEDRHKHAYECYNVTSKRCGALRQWINQVVTQTISRDLNDINAKVKEASTELRTERVQLIKARVKDQLGKDVDIAVADVNTDVDVHLNLNDLARTEGIDPNSIELSPEELSALGFLAAGEDLAPPPSKEEVFGEKLEEINKEYQADQSRMESQFAENQARVQQNLEQKLAARKQRRARKKLDEMERAQFIGGQKK